MLKLVIVEDEDIIREGLISCVDWGKMGYEIVGEAENGRSGIAVIEETKPDVIVTDIHMPVKNGLDMIRELRNDGFKGAVVILSGYEDFEYARRAMKMGISDYLLKPVEIDLLQEIMNRIHEEVSVQKEEQEEYRLMKSREEYNRSQSLKYFVSQILTGTAVNNMSEEVLLEFEQYYYSVILISSENFQALSGNYDYLQIVEEDQKFEQAVRGVLRELSDIFFVKVNMGERILCMSGEDRGMLGEKINLVKCKLLDSFHTKDYVDICVGAVGMGVGGLKKVYRRVRQKQKEKYLNIIHDIVKVESTYRNVFHYMRYDATDLFVEIKTGNYASIEKELENFEKELGGAKMLSRMHQILVMTNLYSELMKLPEEVGGTIKEIINEPMDYYKKMIVASRLEDNMGVLGDVCRKLNDYFLEVGQRKNDSVLKHAIECMQNNYSDPYLQIKDVANAAGVSNSYLSVIIKQGTGKTFVEYLTELRMQKAKKLLQETELKNYEIAGICGFANATYFSTVFKSFYGMSPSALKSVNEK